MNILQCGLALSVCVLTTADKIPEYPSGFPAANDGQRYFNHGNRYFEGQQNILPFAFGKGIPNNVGHQFGGYHNPLFTPVLVQPIKTGVTFDNGWKGIETGHGSIKQGLAIANAAFGQRAVIPVYEHVNDIPPTKTDLGIQNFGYVGNIGHQRAIAIPLNNFVNNFSPLHQNSNFNVKDAPKINKFKNFGSHKGFRNHQESLPKYAPHHGNHHESPKYAPNLGNHHDGPKYTPHYGNNHDGPKYSPKPHQEQHIPNTVHQNENHENDYGHSHDKATSYQSFVIHSYKPVPVYAKYHKHEYDADDQDNTGSRGNQSH